MSDSTSQVDDTVFDDMASNEVENAAKSGARALLHVELDRRPGEEAPRVTVRSLQLFEALSKRTRLQLEVEVDDAAALAALATLVGGDRGGNGELRLRARLDGGAEAEVVLGRDFALDAELAARIERVPGVTAVRLSAAAPPRLALVG